MKKNKIIISVLFIAIFVMLALCCTGCTEEQKKSGGSGKKEYVIAVISDPQIVAAAEVGDDDYASFQDFNAIGQKMLFISEAILKTAVDRLIEAKPNVVLIPGDLTENGAKAGHEMVASQCARLEEAGIPTYVVCGNHDINKNPKRYMKTSEALEQGLTIYEEFADGSCSVRTPGVSPQEFTEIFYEFGFKDAVALDTLDAPVRTSIEGYSFEEVGTMSYVQDLPGSNYRLITIDAANYYEDENENTYYMAYYGAGNNRSADIKGTGYSVMTDRLLNWVKDQLIASEEAGKKPLVMAHFPFTNQMGDMVGQITDGIDNRMNMVDGSGELLELFSQYGVEYTFTGHLHTQHTVTYTDSYYEKTVTDIETGCLTNYPLPMRFIKIKNGTATIENEYIDAVKEEYLPAYLNNEEIKEAVLTGLQTYALDPFIYDNLLYNFDRRIMDDNGEYTMFYDIFDMLELDPDNEHPEELAELADYIYNDLYMAFMKMPLYKTAGKVSLEDICERYDISLPESKYESVFQFFIQLLGAFYKYDYASGDPQVTFDNTEGQILRYGVYSIFEILRTSELFTRLHALNPDIAADIISQRFVEKMFKEGTIDFLCDGFITKVLTIVQPVLPSGFNLKNLSAEDLVDTLDIFGAIPLLFSLGNEYLPGSYDETANTFLGVPVDSLLKIGYEVRDGEEVPVMEIYFDNILRDIVIDKIGDGVLR